MTKNTKHKRIGNIDTAYKVRSLLRKVIQMQINKEISTNQHSAINGSIGLVLKTIEMKNIYEKAIDNEKSEKDYFKTKLKNK